MLVSMPGVVLLGLVIWLLMKVRYFHWLEVLICSTFGFLLAKTAAAPVVQELLDGVAGFLGQF